MDTEHSDCVLIVPKSVFKKKGHFFMRKLCGGFCKVIGEKHVRLMVGGPYSEECIADSIRSKETIRNTSRDMWVLLPNTNKSTENYT